MSLTWWVLTSFLAGLICWWGWRVGRARKSLEDLAERPGHIVDDLLQASESYGRGFAGRHLSARPARKVAVVACMDCRIQVEDLLGLRPGEAHIIRNAGGIVTDDVLRSLIVSRHVLGTEEILLIGHTDCGLCNLDEAGLRARLTRKTGQVPAVPASFHAFHDVRENLLRQIKRVRQHPWLPNGPAVRGCIYDVRAGTLTEVVAGAREPAA